MKKLLIGYDGSKPAKKALLDLESAGIPDPVEATVLSVADVWLPSSVTSPNATPRGALPHPSKTALMAFAEAQRLSKEGAHLLGRLFPEWRIVPEAVAGSPAWALVQMAEERKSDLVVIGAHAQPILDRYLFGSIAAEIVTAAPCSVRICRPTESQYMDGDKLKVFLAIDGSNDSALAYREVLERNWPKDASFRIATVLDSKIVDSLAGGQLMESVREHFSGLAENIAALAARIAEELRSKGFAAESFIVEGNPRSELLKAAEEWSADCILIGARGLHHDFRRRLGTVASAVARRAHCTVEVVRRQRLSA